MKFEPIQAFMHGLVACKNEDGPSKNEGARVFTTFLPVMDVLVTCKNEEILIKNEGTSGHKKV